MRTAPSNNESCPFVGRMLAAAGSVMLLCAALAQPASAAGDDYLKALDEEAGTLEFLGKARKEQEQLQRAATSQKPSATNTPTSTDRAAFEKQLKEEFPASYTLYVKIKPQNKDVVFEEYSKSSSPGLARFYTVLGKIIAIYMGGG